MNEQKIIELLKETFDAEPQQGVLADHPRHSAQCPRTSHFAEGVARGWREDFRHHVYGCDFCKRVSAMQWNIHPPDARAVWRHTADGTLPDDDDLRQFLDEQRYTYYAALLKRFADPTLSRDPNSGRLLKLSNSTGFLAQLAADPVQAVRQVAVCALAEVGSPDALRALLFILENAAESSPVRVLAAEAVGGARAPEALPALEALRGCPDADLRTAAEAAINAIVVKGPPQYGTPLITPRPVQSRDLFAGAGPLEEQPRPALELLADFVRPDGQKQELGVEILTAINAEAFETLREGVYWSVNKRLVVILRVRRQLFPPDLHGLSVSVVTSNGVEIPSHFPKILTPDEEVVVEFQVPDEALHEWCARPRFLLRPVDETVLGMGQPPALSRPYLTLVDAVNGDAQHFGNQQFVCLGDDFKRSSTRAKGQMRLAFLTRLRRTLSGGWSPWLLIRLSRLESFCSTRS